MSAEINPLQLLISIVQQEAHPTLDNVFIIAPDGQELKSYSTSTIEVVIDNDKIKIIGKGSSSARNFIKFKSDKLIVFKVEKILDSRTLTGSSNEAVPSIILGNGTTEFWDNYHNILNDRPALAYINGETEFFIVTTPATVLVLKPILTEDDINIFLDLIGVSAPETSGEAGTSEETAETETETAEEESESSESSESGESP